MRLHTLVAPLRRDHLLHLLACLAAILVLLQPHQLRQLPASIHWPTICTLTGLLVVTRGIEESGYLTRLGRLIMRHLRNERPLALFLVTASALLATVLTNDIALFITVPLTLGLRRIAGLPIARLIIFEALAVNTGSLLTPIGNPQNILLWQRSMLGFGAYTWQMLPLAAALCALLLGVTAAAFPSQPIRVTGTDTEPPADRRLLGVCSGLYAAFLIAVDMNHPALALLGVMVCVGLICRQVLLDVDWALILVFMLMFVDIRLISEWVPAATGFARIAGLDAQGLYLAGLVISQTISNVPATILLLKYTSASKAIAYGVNVGGFGLLHGSLANLIALRMAKSRAIWWQFHLYSIPMLAVAGIVGYWLI